MKSDLHVNSSDLERARAIARGLEGPSGSPRELAEDPLRFSLSRALARQPDGPHTDAPVFDLALPPGAPWTQVVDYCLAQTGAMGIVIVDESGFVIASAGHWREWSELHLEAVSARLMAALDQVQRLEGPWGRCDAIVLSLGADFLTGLRVDADTGCLTVALLASLPLPNQVRRGLHDQLHTALNPA